MTGEKEMSPADKAKQAAADKAAEQAAADKAAEKAAADAEAELKAKADAEAERIMASDEGANENDEYVDGRNAQNNVGDKRKQAEAAYTKLRNIALDFQRSTPDEHTLFGRAGIVFTLGDLRSLTNVRD